MLSGHNRAMRMHIQEDGCRRLGVALVLHLDTRPTTLTVQVESRDLLAAVMILIAGLSPGRGGIGVRETTATSCFSLRSVACLHAEGEARAYRRPILEARLSRPFQDSLVQGCRHAVTVVVPHIHSQEELIVQVSRARRDPRGMAALEALDQGGKATVSGVGIAALQLRVRTRVARRLRLRAAS